ncbi:putative membrane protein (Fun14 family) [Neobacillus ginsengisoli]|uniref:Membrane protein (Fun14 family) n=1 Tax=Neobacillus ginsengisoli TaxID=904295 RepID=A0ABT9XY77_9BACI|nr:putative membrane protein (Fun14 family) [Neobacillus ginsengisoli]
MAETRTNKTSSSNPRKKVKPFPENVDLFRLLKVILLILFSLLFVYLYYLHTKGTLTSTMVLLWKLHKKVIMAIFGFAAYSLVVFYLGVRKGRKR